VDHCVWFTEGSCVFVYKQIFTITNVVSFLFGKVWSQREFPLIKVGRMVLDRNPTNYFAQVEQLAFCPAHLVPGVEPSPDKMLQVKSRC